MSESRKINFSVNLDTSQVPRQAEQSAKVVRSELEKQKQVIDRIMTDLVTSGGKLRVPIDDFRAAVATTSNTLDKMGETNAQAIDRLQVKYQQLSVQVKKAYESGNIQAMIGLQNGQQRAVEMEIKSRQRLDKEIIATWSSLDALRNKVEQNAAAAKKDEQATQSLSQKLAECKKQMEELAAAGQKDSKEYQEASTKAKEYARSLQQVSNDAKPDAHVRLRTELMNAKQAMHEAADKFGRGSIQFQQARDKAIQLQQAMNGLNKQVKNLAAPNATYQGIINGLSGISGAASAATGMMTLFGGESQRTAQAMAKLQAIMSITMGLQSMSMMLNKNSAVQLNIIGRLTTWWAGCKAKAAAATTAETTAVVTNTGAQAAQTAVVEAGTTANVAHAASWKAVGIAIKSVPVFGWIVAAISAIIAAIAILTKKSEEAKIATFDLIDAEKRAEAETKRLKEAQDQMTSTLESGRAEYTLAIAKTRNFTGTKEQEKKIVDQLNSKYGETMGYFSSVADWYNALIKNSENYCRQMIIEARTRSLANQIAQKEQETYNIRYDENGNARRYSTVRQHEQVKVGSAPTYSSMGGTYDIYEDREIVGSSDLDKANAAIRANNQAVANMKKQLQGLVDEAANMSFAVTGSPVKPGGGGSGSGNTPDPNAVAKAEMAVTEAELKAIKERNRQIIEMAFEKEQAEIDIMQEGAVKRERQRQLNYQKEQMQLQQQLEDQITAEISRARTLHDAQERAAKAQAEAAGKKYTEKLFNAGEIFTTDFTVGMTSDELADKQFGDVDKSRIQAIVEYYRTMGLTMLESQKQRLEAEQQAEQLAMQEYLKQYGTFEEKKTAIAAIYAAKRAKATTEAERMTLMQQEKAALDGLDFDDFVTNRAALAFGEIQNLTQATIRDLIIELEKYRDKVTQTFDPDKIEKYNKALADLKRAQAMGQGNVFSQIFTPDFLKERRAAQAEINDAEKAHNALLDAKAQKEEEVKKKVEEIIAKVKELTGQELTADQVKDGSTVNNIIGQLGQQGGNQQGATDLSGLLDNLGKARTELGNVTTASNTAGNALGQMKEAFASKFTGQGGALAMIDTIVHGINDIIQGAKEAVHELASTAEALGADTSVGSGWDKATTVIDALGSASEGATKAWDSLKSGNVMGVVSGVIQSFTAIIKGFAALHDASRERTIQRLQDEIDELERLNRRIEHRLEKQYSKQAAKSYEEEIRNLEKQRELIQQQIAAEQDKKNTDDDRIKEWQDQYEELGWKMEEYKDKALDAILGEDISTSIDNFADKLAESWGKVGDRARATKDFVKAMLKQMVIEAMKTDLTEPIKQLREMMAKALDDDVITEAEEKELEAFTEQIAKETEQKYKWADKILGGSSSSQSGATSGTFATASQDSVTELSGRAAAIHTSGEVRRELLLTISQDLQELRIQAEANKENETEIRNLVLLAVSHLEDISRNTRELYTMNERLEKIEKNTRGL